MAPLTQSTRLEWLHGLRGIAALLVVVSHARYFLINQPNFPYIDAVLWPAASGVDLFFVISGFIMVYTAARGHYDGALDFLIKRFVRVWPAYALMTVGWVVLFGDQPDVHPSAADLMHSLLFIPLAPHNALFFGVTLPIGWTLEFEAYFYVVFAACMIAKPRWRLSLLAGWLVSSVVLYRLALHGWNWSPSVDPGFSFGYANLMTNPIVLEFLAGGIIAQLYLSPLRIASRRLAWNLIFMACAFAFWYIEWMPGPFHGPTKWGAAAAIAVLALAIGSKTVNLTVPPAVSWLGTISYSLYLTHTTTQRLLISHFEKRGLDPHNWGFIFLSTCCAIFVAYFFHAAIEIWLSDLLRASLQRLRTERLVPVTET